MALRLIIEDDEGATTIVPLGDEAVTIGRQDGNTIQLTEKNVSRRHARLWFENGTWVIEDLDSYNGIKVNGELIVHRVTLREGDVIQIGDYHLALAEDTQRVAVHTESAANAREEEPILASSSAHLPVVAPEGPAGPSSASVAGEVSATPAAGAPPQTTGAFEPTPAKKGAPLLVGGLLLVLVAAGGFAVWKLSASDTGGPQVAAAPAPAPSAPTGAAKTAGAVPTEPSQRPPSPPVPTEAEADAAQVQDTTDGAAEAAQESEGAAAEPAPKEAEVAPSPAPKRRRSTRRTKSKAAPPPPPPPPPPKDPPKDPADLLRQARMAQMQGDAAKAYRLAAEANRIKPSKAALRVMGAAACKMGDTSKARSVYRKLSGAAKADMAKLCASRGITL